MELPEVFENARIVKFERDSIFLEPDEGDKYAWYILSGIVRQYLILDDGSEYSLNLYKSGSVLSLTWIFGNNPNYYFFQALTDVSVARLPVKTYRNYLDQHPHEALTTLKRLSSGLDGFFTRLATNSKNDARARILNEVQIESMRFNANGSVPLTTQRLANRTGLARETVSRTVTKLIDERILVKTNNGIALRSHFDPDHRQNS